jgi:hypothetical protein
MAKGQISTKRIAISKANAQMVGIMSIACFLTIFCLFAAKAVLAQNKYRSKVISADEKAHQQLEANIVAANQLVKSYKSFVSSSNNVIGGSSAGTGNNDGDNGVITLDALPSTYDFPALTSSIEKVLNDRQIKISSITGIDDQVAQESNTASANPQPIAMPFSVSVTGINYQTAQQLFTTLELSIRPIQIDSVTMSGGSSNLQISINAHTYYQPGENLTISKQAVTK